MLGGPLRLAGMAASALALAVLAAPAQAQFGGLLRKVTAPTSFLGASHREYRRMVQAACTASLKPIFLPSAYVRPL